MGLPEFSHFLRQTVCEEYQFPPLTEFTPLWTSQNRTFRVTTTAKSRSRVLRLYQDSWRTVDAIRDELRVLSYIADNSELPIPKPIKNRRGELLTVVMDQNINVRIALFSFVGGRHVTRISHSLMFRLGAALSQLDHFLEEADNMIRPAPSESRIIWDHEALIEWPLKSLLRVVNNSSIYGLDHLEKEWFSIDILASRLKERFCNAYTKLPKQLLHGDAIFPNIKFGTGEVGILDFDEMGYGARIYELAPPLCTPQILRTSVAYAPDLVAGYNTNIQLNKLEVRSLPLFVAARLFGSLGWAADHVDIPWAKDSLQTAVLRFKHIAALLNSYENNEKVLEISPSFYDVNSYGWKYYSTK
ncbi:MAG: phosphotransferase [Anaerolineales bacterium]|nr:MAG: phosphotransferase [Anaerolineales bacterium]